MFVKKPRGNIFLPQGYPASVKNSYLDYSLWSGGMFIASAAAGVLST
jgi:hypothetical protein